MDIMEVSIIHHIALVLLLLWVLMSLGWCHPVLFFVCLFYLFAVNERYTLRLRRRLQFEERKSASQKRLLSDSETVRWLNHVIEKVWPVCMEQIASQQFLLPIIPWFLDKYKPWTARKAVVQQLYLGRSPPWFTEIRVLGESPDDDHLVLELGLNFLSADNMNAILAVQLRKTLGFGIWAKLHVTSMQVEGKVLVGMKFLQNWPFLGRVRVCFVEPPYFQMTVKPIFSHGVDVTELPGIAGWLDKILAVAFEQTLVEPNMLVVDVEKFVSGPKDSFFTVDEKCPIAFAKVEIIEATDMKPSDMNGLADPYVKGQLGPYRFKTKIQKKTLAPKWVEEFKIPITSWEAPNVLVIEVRDKDHIFDDLLGDCSINVGSLRGGQRHDKWLPLQNVKMGRLHLAVTILEGEDEKGKEPIDGDEEPSEMTQSTTPRSTPQNFDETDPSLEESRKMVDEFEPINIQGQEKTGIWVHHPGNNVSQTWEPRKGRVRRPETHIQSEDNNLGDSPRSGSGNNVNEDKGHRISMMRRGRDKISSALHRSPKNESPRKCEVAIPSPHSNIRAAGEKGITVKLIVDDNCTATIGDQQEDQKSCSPEKGGGGSPRKGHVRDMAKNILKQAGKSAHNLKGALNKKSLKKSKEEASALPDKQSSQGSESSDDGFKDDPSTGGVPMEIASRTDIDKESDKESSKTGVIQVESGQQEMQGKSLVAHQDLL